MKSAHLLMILLAGQVPAQMDIAETLRRELASLDKQIAADPKRAEAYHERGCLQFKLGNFNASVRDFDKYLELQPERKAGHWQRGISCYYAGLYDEGRKQ